MYSLPLSTQDFPLWSKIIWHFYRLHNYCFELSQQEFLADYGMIWVGPESDHDIEDKAWKSELENQPATGSTSTHSFWNPGKLILRNFKFSLNVQSLLIITEKYLFLSQGHRSCLNHLKSILILWLKILKS
jgi:hypothetical protein